jgi:hypothetical protein
VNASLRSLRCSTDSGLIHWTMIADLRWPDTEVLVASEKALAAYASERSVGSAYTHEPPHVHADASVVIAALDAIRLIEIAQSVRANMP